MIAGVAKIMSNMDLVGWRREDPRGRALQQHAGPAGRISSRLQPNHPRDSVEGILAAVILDGLSCGNGDAVIGVNPSTETVRSTIEICHARALMTKVGVPTQNCVLSHITIQMQAMQRGAPPTDLCFRSPAPRGEPQLRRQHRAAR